MTGIGTGFLNAVLGKSYLMWTGFFILTQISRCIHGCFGIFIAKCFAGWTSGME